MKKLYAILLILAIVCTMCMRFAFTPQKSPNNLFVDDVVIVSIFAKRHIVNKDGDIVADIDIENELKNVSTEITDTFLMSGFDAEGFAIYGYMHYKIPYEKGGFPWMSFGYINTKGEFVLRKDFGGAYNFDDGIAAVAKDGKSGYIDTKGNTVIDFEYEWTYPFNDGSIAPVRIESRYGYINKQGEIVIERQFDEARSVVNGIAVAENSGLDGNKAKVTECYIINDKTKEIIAVDYDEVSDFAENGMAAARREQLYGYINTEGEEVILPQFIEAGSFSEGLAPVKTQDEKWCYINEQGEIVIEFEDTMKLGSFSNGLAWVANENRKYGYINRDGEMVIEQKFRYNGDDIDFYDDGYAVVETKDYRYGVIDKEGNFVLEPIYSSIN